METLKQALEKHISPAMYRIIISNPCKQGGRTKIQVRPIKLRGEVRYQATSTKGTQVFHENLDKNELIQAVCTCMATEFRQLELTTPENRVTCLVSKKGTCTVKCKAVINTTIPTDTQSTLLSKENTTATADTQSTLLSKENIAATVDTQSTLITKRSTTVTADTQSTLLSKESTTVTTDSRNLEMPAVSVAEHNRQKHYLLSDKEPLGFLIDLGVQTPEGVIIRTAYDKFRQINRFLEFIEDILPKLKKDGTIRIIDFGCGKSYLTFAVYHYLHELCGLDVSIIGLDLKADAICKCNNLTTKYGYENLRFLCGDIKDFEGTSEFPGITKADDSSQVDMVITLHACDTATDYALDRAVRWGAKAILSVPCCQHELNGQISCELLRPALKYGMIKERMSALLTDAIRAELLEQKGYDTQILEFVDLTHTPKNLLIRAVKRPEGIMRKKTEQAAGNADALTQMTEFLGVQGTLQKLWSQSDDCDCNDME